MNERITKLWKKAQQGDIFPKSVAVELDSFDENLAEPLMVAKRLKDYILAQPIELDENSELIGLMKFGKAPVPADIFPRNGHKYFHETAAKYYRIPQENLCTFEWQHSNANFAKLIRVGMEGLTREINEARNHYLGKIRHLEFLAGLEMIIHAWNLRADQYRAFCLKRAAECTNSARKETLLRMARNVSRVPRKPASTFEEAIQCLYMCFCIIPDSIGRPDQYLYPLYKQDIEKGTLTPEHAKELIQELFIMIHRYTSISSSNDDKGAESHFAVGGYTLNHEDGFNELSALIVDAMMDMPQVRPQVSLRWNKKTPRAVLRKLLDCERKDKFKRFAFVNDEPRIASLMKINKYPYEIACDYIMVGCNEPAFQGGISLGGNTTNAARSIVNTLNNRRQEILEAKSFDEFYTIYEQELHNDLETMLQYTNRFNSLRSRDCNVLSSLLLDGCIERAESATRGGASLVRGGGCNLMGAVNVIDSLTVIKQFVYEEKCFTLAHLLEALDADWNGYEELRQLILHKGRFFGNNDEFSNEMANRFYASIYAFAKDRTDIFGTPLTYGNLTGYLQHYAWFGERTGATPDGRVSGAPLGFGSGQSFGKDHEGATGQLMSVAHMDPTGVMCGNTIMNLTVDESTVKNDETFEKLVTLIETYFQQGGLHIQLNHVSREELINAQNTPDEYKSLRVRVSGFSATFVKLEKAVQDNVIDRTTQEV